MRSPLVSGGTVKQNIQVRYTTIQRSPHFDLKVALKLIIKQENSEPVVL